MAFKAKSYTASDLNAPKGTSGRNGNNSENAYAESIRLNGVLSMEKTAKVGTAKEIVVALVGMFRAKTPNGNIHALKAIDPEDGTEGVLFLNTQLVDFEDVDTGSEKHFVAGNFYGNCLTTFGRRVSESVDEGYDGDYYDCDGEWVLKEDFYGQVIHLGRKAIPPKNKGGRVYQVLEWRCETEREYPHLAEFLAEYEDREEVRVSAAEVAAFAVAQELGMDEETARVHAKRLSARLTGKDPDKVAPNPAKKTAKVKPATPTQMKRAQKEVKDALDDMASGQPEKPGTVVAKATAARKAKAKAAVSPESYVRDQIGQNVAGEDIVFNLQVLYKMDENAAADLVDAIANEGEEVEAEVDPMVTRALELLQNGSTPNAVSKKLTVEFVGVPSKERTAAVTIAHEMINGA
jgi:hypothetical protein